MKIVILLLSIIVMFPSIVPAAGKTSLKKVHALEALISLQVEYGTYEIAAYVVDKYSCPRCVSGQSCKPCNNDFIVISSHKTVSGGYQQKKHQMIVFVDDASEFEIKKKYLFLIQVLDVKSTEHMLNNVKLIHHKRIY